MGRFSWQEAFEQIFYKNTRRALHVFATFHQLQCFLMSISLIESWEERIEAKADGKNSQGELR